MCLIGLVLFVLNLYQQKRPLHIGNLQSLRWYMFSKYQYSSKKLPPTISTLRFAIYRSHLICNIWKKSTFSLPTLLNPEDYGWKYDIDNNRYEAIMTDQLPAPQQIVELSICKCKSGCDSARCSCNKNNLVCTELCLCEDCQNALQG